MKSTTLPLVGARALISVKHIRFYQKMMRAPSKNDALGKSELSQHDRATSDTKMKKTSHVEAAVA